MSKARILEAVRTLDLPEVRSLLSDKPALLSVVDRQGLNLLHLACAASPAALKVPESAVVRLADLLLAHGLEIDAPVATGSAKGCTALWFSVGRGRNLTLARHLLRRGADVNKAPGGGLYAAGWYEDIKILDVLIGAGAEVDVVVGVTPFLACWYWKKFESAKLLAQRGADVNYRDPKKGRTALHYGVEKEFDPALLAWLVKHGASPDIEDDSGVTARTRASRKRDQRWLAALAGSGAR
jgi:ankyrin repeat protein